MALQFTAEQRRVLGVLMEKALATPEYYPITLNAIVAACNQKSNRNPVVRYGEAEVGRALHELSLKRLVGQADAGAGARANRFEHRVHEELDWNRRQRAVLAELMLRGPQTVGELRTHTARMVALPDVATVTSVLEDLMRCAPPVVRVLPRGVGQSAVRYDHLLYPPEEQHEEPAEALPQFVESEGGRPLAPDVPPSRPTVGQASVPTVDDDLRQRLEHVEKVLDRLEGLDDLADEVRDLSRRLETLEQRVGLLDGSM